MTIAELLSFLGLAWSRLLIFPGGLFALAVMLAWEYAAGTWTRGKKPGYSSGSSAILEASAVILPWLGLALLPLPLAAPLVRPMDLMATLALLEWPRLLAIGEELRSAGRAQAGVRRLATALNSYPPLILALLVVAQANGTLETIGMGRLPANDAPLLNHIWFWVSAVTLLLALPPLLECGPFAARDEGLLRAGMRLRALGMVLLAALPWLAPLSRDDAPGWFVLFLPLPPLLIAAMLWGFHRLTRQHAQLHWARIYQIYDLALLLLLMGMALAELWERLR